MKSFLPFSIVRLKRVQGCPPNDSRETGWLNPARQVSGNCLPGLLGSLMVAILILAAGLVCAQDETSRAFQQNSSAPQQALPDTPSEKVSVNSSANQADEINSEYQEDEIFEEYANNIKSEKVEIADPLEPLNRVMHQFNDRLYFWALKPVARGYKAVVPEPARISVKNFFTNLKFPSRFLSCLLQADFSGAATEAGRFTINTIWGIGGLLDPSAGKELNLQMQDTDLGQTLGVYGVGHGFYIVWPVFGPSSPRDSVDIAGDYFLDPVSYVSPWYAGTGVKAYKEINATSLRIGDYEALKDAAIDPYVAFRDAYIQYRMKQVKARKAKLSSSSSQSEPSSTAAPEPPEKVN